MPSYIHGTASAPAAEKLDALQQFARQSQVQVFNASDARNRMLFFAFDGTGNNKVNPPPKFPTHVAKIRSTFGSLGSHMRLALAALLIGALSACATGQGSGSIEHGFSVKNNGDSKIFHVVIRYGNVTRVDCDPHCLPKREGGLWNAPMPIQEEMQVTWQTADGQAHQARVAVRSKVKDLHRLRTLYLEFNGDNLAVVQGLEYANPTLVGRELFPLYP